MNNLYSIVILLIIGWLFGCFIYSAGGTFHALAAVIAIAVLPGTFSDSRRKIYPDSAKPCQRGAE